MISAIRSRKKESVQLTHTIVEKPVQAVKVRFYYLLILLINKYFLKKITFPVHVRCVITTDTYGNSVTKPL